MNVDGPWFVEPDTSRVILFRGINLSGGTKLPVGIPSHQSEGFWVDHDRKVNFVGRPFPIEDADEHLRRLVDYGFNLLRYIVTWEAIEHEGPCVCINIITNGMIMSTHLLRLEESTTTNTSTMWLQCLKNAETTASKCSSILIKIRWETRTIFGILSSCKWPILCVCVSGLVTAVAPVIRDGLTHSLDSIRHSFLRPRLRLSTIYTRNLKSFQRWYGTQTIKSWRQRPCSHSSLLANCMHQSAKSTAYMYKITCRTTTSDHSRGWLKPSNLMDWEEASSSATIQWTSRGKDTLDSKI